MESFSDNPQRICEIIMDKFLYLKLENQNFTDVIHITKDSTNAMKNIFDNFLKIYGFDEDISSEWFRRIGDFLVESSVSILLRKITCNLLDKSWFNDDGSVNSLDYGLFESTLSILHTSSYYSEALCNELCECEFFFKEIILQLRDIHSQSAEKTIHDTTNLFVAGAMGMLLNCSYYEGNRRRLVNLNISPLLYDILDDSSGKKARLTSILILANILTDKEKEKLETDIECIQELLALLREAVEDDGHQSHGFTAIELTRGIKQLSCNDNNKNVLVYYGALDVLHKMLSLPGDKERKVSLATLFSLSFTDDNKEQMTANYQMIKNIFEISGSDVNEFLKNTAHGTLWNLKDILLTNNSLKFIGQQFDVIIDDESQVRDKHVMISYSWKQQELMLNIRNELQRKGYRTWIDVDNMDGSIIDCMVHGVDNSDVVLVCMSSDYKDSDNCRLELEYAYKRNKRIIPLKSQADYIDDGWLGLIMGLRLYHDFSGQYSFESRMDLLVKSLGDSGRN